MPYGIQDEILHNDGPFIINAGVCEQVIQLRGLVWPALSQAGQSI